MFHVRWVVSCLRGPLTPRQIKVLMDPKRDKFGSAKTAASLPANPMGMRQVSPPVAKDERAVVGQGVKESFVPFAREVENVKYHPAPLREAHVHFSSRKAGLEGSRLIRCVNSMGDKSIDWSIDSGCTIPVKSGSLSSNSIHSARSWNPSQSSPTRRILMFAQWS